VRRLSSLWNGAAYLFKDMTSKTFGRPPYEDASAEHEELQDEHVALGVDHTALENTTLKIEDAATLGLLGTYNSLAYRVHEIEKHFHNRERWCGKDATPDGEDQVSAITGAGADEMNPYVSTAGNDTYGAWIQIFGPDDLPIVTDMVKADIHRILITDVAALADKTIHKLQIAWGAAGNTGFAAGDFTEIQFAPEKGGKQTPVTVLMPRINAGTKVWVRHWVDGQNAVTANFFVGIHEYQG